MWPKRVYIESQLSPRFKKVHINWVAHICAQGLIGSWTFDQMFGTLQLVAVPKNPLKIKLISFPCLRRRCIFSRALSHANKRSRKLFLHNALSLSRSRFDWRDASDLNFATVTTWELYLTANWKLFTQEWDWLTPSTETTQATRSRVCSLCGMFHNPGNEVMFG